MNDAEEDKILDTDTLVLKLEETKENAAIIIEAQRTALITEKEIEESRKV